MREGNWKEYYPDGTLKAIGSYQNDEREGQWKFYFQGGSWNSWVLISMANPTAPGDGFIQMANYCGEKFYNGLSDGVMTEYDEEGKIITQGDYMEGKEEGKWFYKGATTAMKAYMPKVCATVHGNHFILMDTAF